MESAFVSGFRDNTAKEQWKTTQETLYCKHVKIAKGQSNSPDQATMRPHCIIACSEQRIGFARYGGWWGGGRDMDGQGLIWDEAPQNTFIIDIF